MVVLPLHGFQPFLEILKSVQGHVTPTSVSASPGTSEDLLFNAPSKLSNKKVEEMHVKIIK